MRGAARSVVEGAQQVGLEGESREPAKVSHRLCLEDSRNLDPFGPNGRRVRGEAKGHGRE